MPSSPSLVSFLRIYLHHLLALNYKWLLLRLAVYTVERDPGPKVYVQCQRAIFCSLVITPNEMAKEHLISPTKLKPSTKASWQVSSIPKP